MEKNSPLVNFPLHKKNPPREKTEAWEPRQKNPKSRMAHLRMFMLCEPGRRLRLSFLWLLFWVWGWVPPKAITPSKFWWDVWWDQKKQIDRSLRIGEVRARLYVAKQLRLVASDNRLQNRKKPDSNRKILWWNYSLGVVKIWGLRLDKKSSIAWRRKNPTCKILNDLSKIP